MPICAVFFDLGGVIVRTEYQAPRERLAERLNMTYEDLYRVVFESESARRASMGEITTEQHWEAVARTLHRPASEARLVREEFFAGDVIDFQLVQYIRSLRPRYRTGLISNAWPDWRAYIIRHKLDQAFEVCVISAEVGVMKPEPRIFQMALEQARVRPHEAVFVDDTLAHVEAARRLGMHALLFRDSQQVLSELNTLLLSRSQNSGTVHP